MSGRIRAGIVGVGEFGRHHARIYSALEGAELVGVFDTDPERARRIAAEHSTRAFDSLEALAAGVEAVSVAVPTASHAAVGCELLRRGVDVLVEKPIAASMAEATQLVETAAAHSRILQVGHAERFNPAVVAAAGLIHNPLFFEVHRLGVFSGRSLDVDVVFDLMIHDLDILLSLVGRPVESVHAAGIPILTERPDIASVRLEFEGGCVANLTASRVSTEMVRKLRVFQPHAYISVDYARRDALRISVDEQSAAALLGAARESATGGIPPGLNIEKIETNGAEPLVAELESFLEAVRTRQPGPANGEEGRDALALAERVATGIEAHHRKVSDAMSAARA